MKTHVKRGGEYGTQGKVRCLERKYTKRRTYLKGKGRSKERSTDLHARRREEDCGGLRSLVITPSAQEQQPTNNHPDTTIFYLLSSHSRWMVNINYLQIARMYPFYLPACLAANHNQYTTHKTIHKALIIAYLV